MGTMRAAVYYTNSDVRVEERPVPAIGDGEVLVKIRASGICGSDVMEWYRVPKAPVVLGHELSGEIAAAGKGVDRRVGERVVASHHVPCLECRYCRAGHETVCDTLRTTHLDPGGFAEFARVPAVNVKHGLFTLPEKVSFDEATFVEPLGCVVRGQRFAGVRAGDVVAVLGSGLTGLLHTKLATARGAAVYATDPVGYRRQAAERAGAKALDAGDGVPERLRTVAGHLADRVIVCTGAPAAIAQAFRCVDRGGTVLFFAPADPGREVPMPFNEFWREEITLASSYGAAPRDMEESLALLTKGTVEVESLISHRLPMTRAGEGFRLTAEAGESLKVVLDPTR